VEPVEQAVAEAERTRPVAPVRVFCPVWRDPWMSVGADTYAHDLLTISGGANVFAERRERRYPLVTLADVAAAAPEVVLLPDEPYAFGPRDVAELRRLPIPAAPDRIHCIDGTWVSWYGARVRTALATLRRLLYPPPSSPPGRRDRRDRDRRDRTTDRPPRSDRTN
jgi:ABC-type Fe3+-hydroxamate transport system substrate-binding protein